MNTKLLMVGLYLGLCSSSVLAAQDNQALPIFHTGLTRATDVLKQGHAVIQMGGYWGIQGKQQHINIQDLIGDEFTVTKQYNSNGVVGGGYLLEGQKFNASQLFYGLNAFYLAKTNVDGFVIQENMFTNLSYHYNITQYPLYVVAKSLWYTPFPKYALSTDIGIGPNFVQTNHFNETSVDGQTIPDNIFSGHTTTTFSATVGINLRFNHIFGEAPLECGYRFFYLGQGKLAPVTNQVLNTLNTGNLYANAAVCTFIV